MTFMILAKAATPALRAPFHTWMDQEFPARYEGRIAGCTVTLASPSAHEAAYDTLVEGDAASPALLAELREAFTRQGAEMSVYAVRRMVEKAPPAPRRDAVKFVACIRPRPDLSPDEIRRRWNAHVPLALRIHIGVSRYVRNWVDDLILSSSPAPIPYCGIATMAFHTEDDYRDRLYDRPENEQVILNDVATFMAGVDSFLGRESVVVW